MARAHKRNKGVEVASLRPGWVSGGSKGPGLLTDADLGCLYEFFVMEVPSEKYSTSSVSLQTRGWGKKPWSNGALKKELLDERGLEINRSLFICTSTQETKALFQEAGMTKNFARNCKSERIAVYHDGRNAQFISILIHIRHAFAHGRWTVRKLNSEIVFYFESGVPVREDFKVRSRMVLKYSTLKEWMRIIKDGKI